MHQLIGPHSQDISIHQGHAPHLPPVRGPLYGGVDLDAVGLYPTGQLLSEGPLRGMGARTSPESGEDQVPVPESHGLVCSNLVFTYPSRSEPSLNGIDWSEVTYPGIG